jgi:uncharacterized protein YuzE
MLVPVRIKYERGTDAAYLHLVDEVRPGEAVRQIVVADVRLTGEVVLDFDATGKLLGIEVLGASGLLRPETLSQAVEPADS